MLYADFAARLAYALRLLHLSGAIAAFAVGAVVFEGGGLGMAVALLLFFCTSIALGRLPRRRKESLAADLGRPNPRNAVQVLANGGVAAALCGMNLLEPSPSLLAGELASLCGADADTWATEIGLAFGRVPFRVMTLKRSPPGPSGVVSVQGLVVALAEALFSVGPVGLVRPFSGEAPRARSKSIAPKGKQESRY